MSDDQNEAGAQDAPANSSGETQPVFDANYVKGLREEAAKWRTALREKEAELSAAKAAPVVPTDDMKALKAEIEQLKAAQVQRDADIKAKDAALLRQRVASELGLPAKLAERLHGEDEDSIRADAQALAEELPKVQGGRLTPGATVGVPSGQAQGITREQLLDKLYGRKRSVSAPASDAGDDDPKVFRRGG